MANGDRAAAVGMDTVAGTDDRRQGFDEINKSRDYLADHRTDGTHPASAITSGTLAAARVGFQIAGGIVAIDFNDFGNASVEHGLSWTPTVVMITPRLINAAVFVVRGSSPPGSEAFSVKAFHHDGAVYTGNVSAVEWLAWRAA